MQARRLLAAAATSAVAVSVLAITAAPAQAYNPHPDDTSTTITPTVADLVGVGSDTSQQVIKTTGDAFNATNPAAKVFSYAACQTAATCGTIKLPTSGDTKSRPNGSGPGRARLFGADNDPDIDFARSSGPISGSAETAALRMFPFAVDTLVMAAPNNSVAGSVPVTPSDILKIYEGTYTKWNQVNAALPDSDIHPKVPQTGSGTRSFFQTQLNNIKGVGQTANILQTIPEVQEHDPVAIQDDPLAIAPFSKGRAQLAGTLKALDGGFSYDRALYNVVRIGDIGNANILAYMGPNGFLCSTDATSLIEASGFRQLSKESAGGQCGVVRDTNLTTFVTSTVATTTQVTVTSQSASAARVVARVGGGAAPNGRVTFTENGQVVQANVPLVSGAATITPAAAPGAHTYTATFVPSANSSFTGSTGTGTGTVQKATSSIQASFPGKVKFGKKAKGTVTVNLAGVATKATGAVTVKDGSKVVGTGTLAGGKADITLKKLKPGKHTLAISWPGDTNASASETTVKIKAGKKPKKKAKK